jgi:hypothetical protein
MVLTMGLRGCYHWLKSVMRCNWSYLPTLIVADDAIRFVSERTVAQTKSAVDKQVLNSKKESYYNDDMKSTRKCVF